MHNFEEIYKRILKTLRQISEDKLLFYQLKTPRMSDLEVICLSLSGEYLGIDSEHDLFRKLPSSYKAKIDRTVFNRRRRRLLIYTERIRQQLSEALNMQEKLYIVDSMPLEVCKLSRSKRRDAGRSSICKEEVFSSPDIGYCASQSTVYYGYKLYAVCSQMGVFHSLDISPASVHDIQYLKDIKAHMSHCTILGDKGYLSAEWQLDLFNSCNIKLQTPM